MSDSRKTKRRLMAAVLGLQLGAGGLGCTALTPQLDPPDIAAMEQTIDRAEREGLYAENSIYRHQMPQGIRYTKGSHPGSTKRSWQSLDAILRADRNASEALPSREIRRARVLTAVTVVASMVMIAGISASAREGLNLQEINGTGAHLLGGAIATTGFAIGAGVSYNQAKKGYDRAVDVYNDSLGLRLGILDAQGAYLPPPGVIVDEEGYVVLEDTDPERPARVVFLPESKPTPTEKTSPQFSRLSGETIAEVLAGIEPTIARECAELAGTGRSIAAEVTVDGATGAVVQVIADNDQAGACVASQLFVARFPAIVEREQAFALTFTF